MKSSKKIIQIFLASASFLFAANIYAGICANGSLAWGNFGFVGAGGATDASGVYENYHLVGRFSFNNTGNIVFNGYQSLNGFSSAFYGSGSYVVDSNCVASGTFYAVNGEFVKFWFYLDQMDTVPSINKPYHASAVLQVNGKRSFSGELNRPVGKF